MTGPLDVAVLEPLWVDCDCSYADHAMRFVFDHEDGEIYVNLVAKPDLSLLGRIRLALRIVLGKSACSHGIHATTILRRPDVALLARRFTDWARRFP